MWMCGVKTCKDGLTYEEGRSVLVTLYEDRFQAMITIMTKPTIRADGSDLLELVIERGM